LNRSAAWTVYANRRMAVLLGFGCAAGLPSIYRLLGSTLDTWLIDVGVEKVAIGLFALVGLPLTFNFVWAPILDHVAPKIGGLGRRRAWLLLIQTFLVLGIIAMAFLGPQTAADSLWPLAIICLVVSFLVGTQDVILDAYRTDVLEDRELGAGAAVFVNGYRLGMWIAGGGALLLTPYFSWTSIYLMLAGVMALTMLVNALAPEPPYRQRPATFYEAVTGPVLEFVERKGLVAALAVMGFVALFRMPDSLAMKMINVLLQDELGFSKQQLGMVRDTLGMIMLVVGAFAGGWVVARVSLGRALWIFLILQGLSNAGYLLLYAVGPIMDVFVVVTGVENFCAGMATTGLVAFLMSQCHRKYSATQYALFTSLMYGFGLLFAAPTGWLVERLGYAPFFMVTILAVIPAGVALCFVGRLVRGDEVEAQVQNA